MRDLEISSPSTKTEPVPIRNRCRYRVDYHSSEYLNEYLIEYWVHEYKPPLTMKDSM